MTKDSIHTIFRSASHFFSGTILSRITGMLRDMFMAYAFGTGGSVAAFFVAFRFANLLRRLFGEGALQTAFIPTFEKMRNDNPQQAGQFFFNLNALLSLVLLIISLLVMGGITLYLQLGNPSVDNREILFYTAIMQPCLLFICLYGLNSSLLQCERNFFTPGIAPAAMNCIWILGVVYLWIYPSEQAMTWLSVIVVFACMSQWIITLPNTFINLKQYHLKNAWSSIRLITPELKIILPALFLGMTGVAAEQINSAVDPIFARYADTEGPALLWYAIRLQQLPLALFGIAIAGALLPPLSRAIKAKDYVTYQHFLEFALRRTLALMIPISGALWIMGETYITLLYGHGDFNANSITGTTECLWGYSFGLIPMTLILVIAPAFYAQNAYRETTRASLYCILLNIVLNVFFILIMGWSAASVAFATSLSAWANMIQLWIALSTQLKIRPPSTIYYSAAKAVIATSFACSAAYLMSYVEISSVLAKALADSSVFVVTLGLAAWIFKADDVLYFWRSKSHRTEAEINV
jgi:putative peptidoglycan lipid II flippase